ncbi:zinc finger, CCHC-type containing protein, partial [Tanacetum coccineum]
GATVVGQGFGGKGMFYIGFGLTGVKGLGFWQDRHVMEKFNELLRILGQYTQHGLKMDESTPVSSVIDKLPPSWKDFKHTLKHGKDDLSLVQLGSHLRIEESLREQESDKGKGKEVVGPSVNMTEEGVPTRNQSWNVGSVARLVTSKEIVVVVDAIAWWIDSDATTHVCKDHCWFKTHEPVEDGYVLYMGDHHFVLNHGKGSMALEFSSGKTITLAIVRLPDPKRKTLGKKGIDCIFVGYAKHSKAYKCYVIEPNDSFSINSIIESRYAIFDENHFSSIPRPKDIILNLEEYQRDDHSDDVPSETPEPRREEDPRTYDEAMQSRDAAFWKKAIDDEIGSIIENNTWVLSDLPPGFRQKEGIDYFDTYTPVARITTIRLLLALAAIHNLVIHQMDVKTAFLNGDLDEKVYMKQPKGFVMPGNEHKVCKLVKSLYGLKQAHKQ